MSLSLALAFTPQYAAVPASIWHGSTPISPRFPMPGGTRNGLTIGTNGATVSNVTPIRSALEAQQWGATAAVWSYTDRAASLGYASAAQFVGEFSALGIPMQATTNSYSADAVTGPFALDIAGYPFSSGGTSPRPAPLTSPTSLNRGTTYLPWARANDPAGTRTPKLATIATQLSAGCQMLHMDDPRGIVSLAGFNAHIPQRDLTSQTADFSGTALAGFPAWLTANTTGAQRTAVGLPSDATGLSLLDWLEANHADVMHSPGQSNAALVDGYLFRISVSPRANLRTVMGWYGRYLQADQAAWLQQVRASAGVPLSLNLYAGTPQSYMSWTTRLTPQVWDFAISEVSPPYWSQISVHTVGSDAWINARWAQCAEQHMQMALADRVGLLCLCEHKPSAPNQAPPRVLRQMLRQSIMQTVMEGHVPVVPIDVFLTTGDARDQGTDFDGYRFWAPVAEYVDLFQFTRAHAALLRGYEKLAVVHVVASSDSYPFREGDAAARARYDAMSARLAEFWVRDAPYHLMTVGEAAGAQLETPNANIEAQAPLIVQVQEPGDYMSYAGRMGGRAYRRWSTAACDEAANYAPVRSLSPYIRATARYNATTRRVSVHLHNYAVNADGTPKPQTTVVRWNRAFGAAGLASVVRLGEAPGAVDLSRGFGQVSLREYAIVNFAVA